MGCTKIQENPQFFSESGADNAISTESESRDNYYSYQSLELEEESDENVGDDTKTKTSDDNSNIEVNTISISDVTISENKPASRKLFESAIVDRTTQLSLIHI